MTTIAIFVAVFLVLVAVSAFWIWAVDQIWRRVRAWRRRRTLAAMMRDIPVYQSRSTVITGTAGCDAPYAGAGGLDPRR